MTKTIGAVSLGCDKNRVDTENVLFTLKQSGYKITQNTDEADIILINTCAFIDSAKKESLETIFDFGSIKKEGQKLVVMGCLSERYAEEIKDSLPEVDKFIGVNCYHRIAEILSSFDAQEVLIEKKYTPYKKGRVLTTVPHYAYLKIADGCNNCCSYCAIPKIRGNYRSEKFEDLLEESEKLAKDGVKELIIVAQDTTRYGIDLYGKYRILELLIELTKMSFHKIRLMYVYPELISDELIQFISENPKMAKYIDMPLQHIDNGVLKAMNRRNTEEYARELVKKIKSYDSSIAIRSSFIVGFPTETEESYQKLKEFIKEGNIDYAGFFAYSKEENTAAYKLKNPNLTKTRNKRQKELEIIQSQVIVKNNKKYLNKELEVIYEGIDYDKQMFYGRTQYNAPAVDTLVYFSSEFPLDVGNYYNVLITDVNFDLYGITKK